jgi:hypothetical protein
MMQKHHRSAFERAADRAFVGPEFLDGLSVPVIHSKLLSFVEQ